MIAGGFEPELWVTMHGASVVDVIVASTSSDGDGILAIIAGFFIGLYLVYDGFGKWKTKRLMEDTPTENVRSMAVGRTELEGVARRTERTVEAPFTDHECVYIDWEVEEWRKDDDDDYDWETIAQETQAVPFELDDGTGSVLVRTVEGDPTVEVSDSNTDQITVGRGHDPSAEIEEFIERHDNQDDDDHGQSGFFDSPVDTMKDAFGVGEIGYSNRKRRYTQEIIPDGTDVYVLGSAVPRDVDGMADGQEDLLKMTRDEGLDTFFISDMSEKELEGHYERWGPLEVVGGIVLSAGCLALLLGAF